MSGTPKPHVQFTAGLPSLTDFEEHIAQMPPVAKADVGPGCKNLAEGAGAEAVRRLWQFFRPGREMGSRIGMYALSGPP